MKTKLTFFFLCIFAFHCSLSADVIILQSGQIVTGTVLQQDSDGTLIQLDYGTFRYPPSQVKDVRKEKSLLLETPIDGRIPEWSTIISRLAKQEWAHELKQIPATVIDNGVLKDVPYVSFRCNTEGYEINIYGDLDNPAGVEIGAVNYLVKNEQAKNNCAKFIATVLANDGDKDKVSELNLGRKDMKKKDGLTFEITLPSESDSYGGWWVSVYDEGALTNSRASGKELLAISEPRTPPKPQPTASTAAPLAAWSSSDLSYARPSVSDSGVGRVFVRGYTRTDGTYVQSYTRGYHH